MRKPGQEISDALDELGRLAAAMRKIHAICKTECIKQGCGSMPLLAMHDKCRTCHVNAIKEIILDLEGKR